MTHDNWHTLEVEKVLEILNTNKAGLSEKEVNNMLIEYGSNELKEKKPTPLWKMFLRQFESFLIIILIVATIISALIGEVTDAIVILIIVVLNALLGFIQEYRAEKAMKALKKMVTPVALVVRDGKQMEILARDLVPGDIIIIEAGDRIPADARLFEVTSLQVDETILTGESTPVTKSIHTISGDNAQLGDRKNMLYMGTNATYGRGKAVVVNTGMRTEIGKIAELIQVEKEEKTPLQLNLEQVGKQLGIILLLISAIIFVIGALRGIEILQMFLTAVSLAVAAIPEGLPAVVTITLAIGLKRMAKRNAIIRKLPAVETLGCSTVICSDKTGTLTRNEMTVQRIYVNNREIFVSGEGYIPVGEFYFNNEIVDPRKDKDLELILKIGALCNHAALEKKESNYRIIGDPTEGTLLVVAAKAGILRDEVRKKYPRIGEIPFDSETKYMVTFHSTPENEKIAYIKGAPDVVLDMCSYIYENNSERTLTDNDIKNILDMNRNMADDALRILIMAYKKIPDVREFTHDAIKNNLVFVGLVGMIDSPREDAKLAIQLCRSAGIRPVMITGDHKLTAMAVAKDMGLIKEKSDSQALTGPELDNMSDEDLEKVVDNISIYARTSSEHKIRIVRALKKRGHVVAMTGDGVNDAPAIKSSDIGIAMGITGTDVTKEASDMILIDDNFASIVSAVEEGRSIYDNIRKSIKYLLSCNVGEVLTIFIAMITNLPLPLLPIQILWMNLVTDGLPALALGVDPAEPDVMKRPPRDSRERILSKKMLLNFGFIGMVMCIATLLIFAYNLSQNSQDITKARTMAFSVIVMSQLFYVFSCRSERYPLRKIGIFSNKYLIIAVISSIILQVAPVNIPVLQPAFGTTSIGIYDWIVIILISLTAFIFSEIVKIRK